MIREAFENGEDFTIKENEIGLLSTNLKIPSGRTLTVDGTLDLGDGNELIIEGTLNGNGGSITNDNSDITVEEDGIVDFIRFGIDISGHLNIKGQLTAKGLNLKVNELKIEENATVNLSNFDGYTGSYNVFVILIASLFSLFINESDELIPLTIRDNGAFTIGSNGNADFTNVAIKFGNDITTEIKGKLLFKQDNEIDLKWQTLNVIGNNGIIEVSNDSDDNELTVKSGTVVVKADKDIPGGGTIKGPIKYVDSNINIGNEDLGSSDTSKLILGTLDSDTGKWPRTSNIFMKSTNLLTVNNTDGLIFVRDTIIFDYGPELKSFPQGTPTGIVYPKDKNPNFTIPSPFASALRYDDTLSNTKEQIQISSPT